MISDLYDSIVELFKVYGCPAPIYLGEQFKDQHTETLCVVLWQTDDKFTPQLASVLPPITRALYLNPRPIATRKCGLNARLWATAPPQKDPQDQYRADLAYLDALVNQFAIALQQLASGISDIEGGMAADGNAAAVRSGLGYDLVCRVDVPVIDAPWPAQQLDECSKTWEHRPATALITISGKVDPEPPHFQPGTTFPVPTED